MSTIRPIIWWTLELKRARLERTTAMELVRKGMAIPKSLKDLCILDILDGATEEEPLTQEEIGQRLADDYGIEVVDRKTLHRRLEVLLGSVEGLRCKEEPRDGTDGAKTDFRMEREPLFEDSEVRALTYLVVFSKHIPTAVKNEMVEKLDSLAASSLHREPCSYYLLDRRKHGDYNELFLNIDVLSEAIASNRMVSFECASYRADGARLHAEERVVTASPFGLGVNDGDFYLLATTNGLENDRPDIEASHFQDIFDAMEAGEVRLDTYRLDRMKNVEMLDEERERLDGPDVLRLRGADNKRNKFDIREHLRENPGLLSGHSVRAELLLSESARCSISDLVDHFGKETVFVSEEKPAGKGAPATYRATLRTNIEGLRRFALLNVADVEVIKPESLRQGLHELFETAAEHTK